MDAVIEYISSPSTIISFIVFVFGLGVVRANVKVSLENHEKRIKEIEGYDIKSMFAKIMTDLEWLKQNQMKKSK